MARRTVHEPKEQPSPAVHHIYRLSVSCYVQHNGTECLPPEVEAYMRSHGGDRPGYFELAAVPTEFETGGIRNVPWDGASPLPVDVMDYIRENGALPRRTIDVDCRSFS